MRKVILCMLFSTSFSVFAGEGIYLHFDNRTDKAVTVKDVGSTCMNQVIPSITIAAHGSSLQYIETSDSLFGCVAANYEENISVSIAGGQSDIIQFTDLGYDDAVQSLQDEGFYHAHSVMALAAVDRFSNAMGVKSADDSWMGLAYWNEDNKFDAYITIWGQNYKLPNPVDDVSYSYIAKCDIKSYSNEVLTANCLHDPQNMQSGTVSSTLDYRTCNSGESVAVRAWGDNGGNGAGTLYCTK